ncbi:PREDICTED: CTP synthase [Prunus dulcis]|uniref:PREDICTED: CTP synthase n=1 Tax=Prunus dulcis TaxID=3755 RepID=A0A5E4G1R6_PRUDU|nr:PREDICTED: CTP synthase [Prunus dulcis]
MEMCRSKVAHITGPRGEAAVGTCDLGCGAEREDGGSCWNSGGSHCTAGKLGSELSGRKRQLPWCRGGSFLPNTRKLSWPNTPSHIFRVAPSLLSCLASLLVSFEVLDNLCSCAQRMFKKLLWGGLEVANALIFSVQALRGQGLTLTILACRSTKPLEENAKLKLAQFAACVLLPLAISLLFCLF